MKILKYLLFLLLIGCIGIAIYVAVQPNSYQVIETKTIHAPKAVIFNTIADTTDVDLSEFWKSTETLQSSTHIPSDSIHQRFTSPSIKNSDLSWNLFSNPDGSTTVTRSLTAEKLSFFTKAKEAFFKDSPEDISDEFINDLNALAERVKKSMAVYSIDVLGIKEYGGGFYLYQTTSSTGSNKVNAMANQFNALRDFMKTHNISASGSPFTLYIERDRENGNVIMTNAIPVSERIIIAENSSILCGFMDRTEAVKILLKGNTSNLDEAWIKAENYIQSNNLERTKQDVFEIYKKDIQFSPNPADWETELYIPIQPSSPDL